MGEFRFIGQAALIGLARSAMVEAVTESAEDLVGKAQAATPTDTGTLKASIHVDDVSAGAFEVTATVATGGESSEYAIPVHEGSSPHWIEPKSANGFLYWPGAAHPVQRVFHPGAAPTKFLEHPLLANRAVYVLAMQRAAAGVLLGVAELILVEQLQDYLVGAGVGQFPAATPSATSRRSGCSHVTEHRSHERARM